MIEKFRTLYELSEDENSSLEPSRLPAFGHAPGQQTVIADEVHDVVHGTQSLRSIYFSTNECVISRESSLENVQPASGESSLPNAHEAHNGLAEEHEAPKEKEDKEDKGEARPANFSPSLPDRKKTREEQTKQDQDLIPASFTVAERVSVARKIPHAQHTRQDQPSEAFSEAESLRRNSAACNKAHEKGVAKGCIREEQPGEEPCRSQEMFVREHEFEQQISSEVNELHGVNEVYELKNALCAAEERISQLEGLVERLREENRHLRVVCTQQISQLTVENGVLRTHLLDTRPHVSDEIAECSKQRFHKGHLKMVVTDNAPREEPETLMVGYSPLGSARIQFR
jgi:hypothetical protein